MADLDPIVITGAGVISPIGQDVATFSRNLFAGAGGLGPLTFPFRETGVTYCVGEVKNFDPALFIDPKKLPLMDRFAQLGVAAARQAWDDSKLALSEEQLWRTGVIVGSGVGGQNTLEESYNKLLGPGSGRVHPFTIPRLMANAATSHISMALGLQGPGFTVASACASALHAMGTAVAFLRAGLLDRVVTGGTESCLTLGTLRGWEALRVMASDTCRPFSEGRAGMIIGEGAAMFVLERQSAALARGAKIYARIAGFGMSSDAKDLTTPDVKGAARAMSLALADAAWTPREVDYINAHGTGTRINDITETAAIKLALGETDARRVPISSSKSLFGHALGAAGALESLATILALQEGRAPPTANYQAPDPECDLDYVVEGARNVPMRRALNNSFAFGGLNAVLAFEKGEA